MEIDALIERTQSIRDALPLPSVKQRLGQTAQALDRAGDNQGRVELLNESCLALTSILYNTDPAGRYANIDERTYRIIVAAPWGKSGWRRWGLRSWEADVLRKILINRTNLRRVAPLFDFNGETNQWYLNIIDYPSATDALQYWKRYPVTLKEFCTIADSYRQAAHGRMMRHRGER